jgi:hypothetical protein
MTDSRSSARPASPGPVGVYRGLDDPSNVLVVQTFESPADAELFLQAAYLREVMQLAGVEGQARIELYEDA